MDDIISRQAALDAVDNLMIIITNNMPEFIYKSSVLKLLHDLPSVQPKSEDSKFLEFLANTINPNEMEQYLAMYHSKGEKTNG